MNTTFRKGGFTLVELLAVMAIIGILAAMVLGIAGYASFKSDEAKAKADIEKIKQLLQDYRVEKGYMPENKSKMEDWIEDEDDTFYEETDELKDPWGSEYRYERADENGSGSKYVAYVWSVGPDGQNNTKDDIGEHP